MVNYRAPKIAQREPHPIPEGMAGVMRLATVAQSDTERALIAFCGMCGLRVREACERRPVDIDMVDKNIRMVGKGGKERLVPIGVQAWGFLLPAINATPHGRDYILGIKHDWARTLIRNLGIRAGLSRPISSHDLRMTFATDMVQRGVNVRVIQRILGHASLETTMIYLGTSEDDMRKAVR